MRLVRGLGTPCDPIHTGTVEIFHTSDDENSSEASGWAALCVDIGAERAPVDLLAAATVCRQLGFPYGTIVSNIGPRSSDDVEYDAEIFYTYTYDSLRLRNLRDPEDVVSAWADTVRCEGDEEQVLDCAINFSRLPMRCNDCLSGSACGGFFTDYRGQMSVLEVACLVVTKE